MLIRPRRTRQNHAMRRLVRENFLRVDDLIAPLFLCDGKNIKKEIDTMPGQFRFSLDQLLIEIESLCQLKIPGICLFPVINDDLKDEKGTPALDENCFYLKAIEKIKKRFPEILLMTDVALDPYCSHGQDGIVDPETLEVLNDETVQVLKKMSLHQAQAGADIIGPSDMMDGRIKSIRQELDKNNYTQTAIMSYTAKYCSNFYGPFRDALDSAPKNGDKKTYQMDFCNSRESLLEAKLDVFEGADILMVKPGLSYLDIIYRLKKNSLLPIAAYNVSGEYAMIKAAAKLGMLDETSVMLETLASFKRAGADIILTYFAKQAATELRL